MAWTAILLTALIGASCSFASKEANPDLLMQNKNYFEGDIVLDELEKLEMELRKLGGSAYGLTANKFWPDPQHIPYDIDDSLKDSWQAKNGIRNAIHDIEKYTCLRFRRRFRGETPYIRYADGSGCSSPVGYVRWRTSNTVSLGRGCRGKGTVIHETMHSLGFWHEQSRPDRDNYVKIIYNNIKPGYGYNFDKYNRNSINSRGSPYDYDSIMHYGRNYFAIDWRKNTIETIDPKDQHRIGQRNGMSPQDIWQINEAYCGGKTPPPPKPSRAYCIRHSGNLYLSVDRVTNSVVLSSHCTKFDFLPDNVLHLTDSDLCVEPIGTYNDARLIVDKKCGPNSGFLLSEKNSLRHLPTRKCVHPYGGSPNPPVKTDLVIYSACDEDRLRFTFEKAP